MFGQRARIVLPPAIAIQQQVAFPRSLIVGIGAFAGHGQHTIVLLLAEHPVILLPADAAEAERE
ncbi:MAG: hypothetical protein CVU38_21185 [Chloroflexi bacterium HGW-Chloroflexi-1]|nr:MAG: hypothetical protein CVU38_21185 [Chloroflexi bacterium HGW-Chloroflexi-1]